MIRTVRATRYVTPLREGGSLPAIVEADDLGLYVLKFRGAGQGPLALVAELLGGEIARLLQLPVPEIVFVDLDAAIGRNEPDEEIRDLLQESVGLNLALDYLPGSVMFDPAAIKQVDAEIASKIVWFDAYILNVDRTPRNANLLYWHKTLRLIDHGAALYFHHDWESRSAAAVSKFAMIRQHILLPWATQIREANETLKPLLTADRLQHLLAQVPDAWLAPPSSHFDPEERRAGYLQFFLTRLESSHIFTEEAANARLL